jgi:hypothetical protein
MVSRVTLLLLIACISTTAWSVESPESRAADFYAAGLEQPLQQIRTGVRLVAACAGRLRKGCTRQQRELAANDATLTLLDALTLFAAPPADDPAAGITKAPMLAQKIAATSAALLDAAGEYDAALFARYGASLRTCPDENVTTYRASLDELVRIDFTGFRALAGDELATAQAAMARAEGIAAQTLAGSPPEDCVAARRLGEYLMQLMHSKLQPWSGEDRRVANAQREFEFGNPGASQPTDPTREVAHAVAGNFVTVVATELHLTVHPESAPRIKAIADAVEAAKAAQ